MSTFLSTVEDYEGKILEIVESTQSPVVDAVAKGVELLGDRVPAISYPERLPNPIEAVQSQVAFAKKMIDANAAILTAVLETVAPVAGFAKPKKAAKPAVKAA